MATAAPGQANVPVNGPTPQNAPQNLGQPQAPLPPVPTGAGQNEGLDPASRQRVHQVLSSDDFAAFLKERSALEDKHASALRKLSRNTHDLIRRPEGRQGSFAQSYEELTRIHDRMAEHGLQFSSTLHTMAEELSELAANNDKSRKHWKHEGLSAEKRVEDAKNAVTKAESKYYTLAEQYDRARTGESQSGKIIGFKKSPAQHEEDLLRKLEASDADYNTKVQSAQTQQQELTNILRPQTARVLQEIIRETDAALSVQVQKFAVQSEKLLLGYGLTVTPVKGQNPGDASTRGLREVASSIDNDRDFAEYVVGFSDKAGNGPDIKYEQHPSLSPKTQMHTQSFNQANPYANNNQGPQQSGVVTSQQNTAPTGAPQLPQIQNLGLNSSAPTQNGAPPPNAGAVRPPMGSPQPSTSSQPGAPTATPGAAPMGRGQAPLSQNPVVRPAGTPGPIGQPPPGVGRGAPPLGQQSPPPQGVGRGAPFPGQPGMAPQNVGRGAPGPGPQQGVPPQAGRGAPAPGMLPQGAGRGVAPGIAPGAGRVVPPAGVGRGVPGAGPPLGVGRGAPAPAPQQGAPPPGVGRGAPNGAVAAAPRPGPPVRPVFGISLDNLFRRDGSAVPTIVYQCVQAVDLYGLDVEGVYRTSGSAPHIMELRQKFDHDASAIDFRNAANFHNDIASVTTLLKHFLRDLPDPLLTAAQYQGFIDAAKIEDDIVRRDSVHALINGLPDPNYATLRTLVLHLNRIAQRSEKNKMTHSNLAIVFAPTLMGQQGGGGANGQAPAGGADIADAGWQAKVIETILNNTFQIFDDDE
ncbi:Rho GTPase-activating protein [Elasticomyces elasticus]|uniref:Rho GTPase-activating protein n=1 Tax=Exophiala sideris TaxID=1016849 RepID=A0ABR0IW37_9EURO|nr:Rho GTPase-activating protein [Elasticomyces elasticus]KAK5021546.1 Rho GTPase-activating protein [Exophiala sideris]KAK5024534.1 Rho GTPase-activating protein [Exophiala sideris]KAK5049681.1 Rho GTPase-activating protein [Exophiala sideris]KAK5176662.1 Rho GTPase-activating protein [Eurotiomycetes sp. CCFEE 6388]